ncbi:MAG TPA: hypothetical protein VFB23_13165 [Candidatus Acidoferrales bacterium]|jgi:hypothetical protein|nr:hypothetical protein [Candidatus Acidoferrales bacterium]
MSHRRLILIVLTGLLLMLAARMRADSLQLKNGSFVQGKYLGGTERAVQFAVNGKVHLYDTDEILSISFGSASGDSGGIPSNAADTKCNCDLRTNSFAPADSPRMMRSAQAGARAPRTQEISWKQNVYRSNRNRGANNLTSRVAVCRGQKQGSNPAAGIFVPTVPTVFKRSAAIRD